jgi:hypothetical protein
MPEFHESDAEIVYISGKQAEEIGFEKFHQRQAKLQGIRVLVLDHLQIQHHSDGPNEEASIAETCADITDLDLSGNLFETFGEVAQLCQHLPKLRALTLDGNRFYVDDAEDCIPLPSVQSLSLSKTLLSHVEVNTLISSNIGGRFPSIKSLSLAGNEYSGLSKLLLSPSVSSLDLTDNHFTSMSDLVNLDVNGPLLHTLILKRNGISTVYSDISTKPGFVLPVTELDLSYNTISSFTFFNYINSTTFPELKHLRVTGNPLYKSLVSVEGKPLTAEDGYMLTIARLPRLDLLNYSKITEKERLNAETYYLGQIAAELARASEDDYASVLAKHPRYQELCDEYGEPVVQRKVKKDELDPNSLAAKLVAVNFALAPGFLPSLEQRSWAEEIPKSLNIYAVLGIVGKRLAQMPLELCLILETSEKDPVGRDSGYDGPSWWDSDDEAVVAQEEWVKREVELFAGTRALGTFIEAVEANVRVEIRHGDG